MSNSFDFVALGDIVTDAFIRIKEASVTCDVNRDKCKLCVSFGDKVPFESMTEVRAVGNSPNAATSAARLGLKSALITDIGDDHSGAECLATLRKNHVATDFVSTHKSRETNYHYVLWYEEERTILVKHHEYDYKLPGLGPAPKWLYLSSLGENSFEYHQQIGEYLEKNPEVNLAFQPGTFQMRLGAHKLGFIYKRSKVSFCNVSEAKRILEIIEDIDIKDLLRKFRELGPDIVVITDGPKGAYVYDGVRMWFMPPYPDPKPPYERTGAGDAFSSTFAVALAQDKTVEEALMWGPINSMSVVQKVGAQAGLLTREQLEKYLNDAPKDYRPKRID